MAVAVNPTFLHDAAALNQVIADLLKSSETAYHAISRKQRGQMLNSQRTPVNCSDVRFLIWREAIKSPDMISMVPWLVPRDAASDEMKGPSFRRKQEKLE